MAKRTQKQHINGLVEVNAADAQKISGGAYLRGSMVESSSSTSLDGYLSSGDSTQRAGTPGTTLCHLKTTEVLFGCKPKLTI